jgi:hypothetical protein
LNPVPPAGHRGFPLASTPKISPPKRLFSLTLELPFEFFGIPDDLRDVQPPLPVGQGKDLVAAPVVFDGKDVDLFINIRRNESDKKL